MRLYEISAAYAEVQQALEEGQETALAQVDEIKEAFEAKGAQLAYVIKNISATIDALEAEEKRMRERRTTLTNSANKAKEYLRTNMERAGVFKIECPQFQVSLKDNPPRVVVLDETKIPEDCMRHPPPEVDKKRIMERFKSDGEIVPGVEIVRGSRIEIR